VKRQAEGCGRKTGKDKLKDRERNDREAETVNQPANQQTITCRGWRKIKEVQTQEEWMLRTFFHIAGDEKHFGHIYSFRPLSPQDSPLFSSTLSSISL
jgi:hypothetical protein